TSGYVFANGIRNTFDMAYDADGHLFGVENSGDRDHNEEMNWLQKGHHYGFPWKMGDTDNPQQSATFDPNADPLINHYSRSWRQGFWSNDPTFPALPPGTVLDAPIQNYGPDCDKFRDTITGDVLDASDLGITIGTFTGHRSPLGLVFDRERLLHPDYRGDGFMLSWTQGYDSCGCTTTPDTAIGPYVDPSQDLVHLDLEYDSLIQNFTLHAKRIVADFSHPVDDDIYGNSIYVLENGYGGTSGLYEITFPFPPDCTPFADIQIPDPCTPSTNQIVIDTFGIVPNQIDVYEINGTNIHSRTLTSGADTLLNLSPGIYYILLRDAGTCTDSIYFTIQDSVHFDVITAIPTSCIGCQDGGVTYTEDGGNSPYLYTLY
ncbi:MAG TPA: PQQ-dependent sugar dehydrogenase, partial [Bacteroidia bacterium]|nr:PQQ-dependent sugar dehydrogenase [Bacteroidia bacterium]